MEIINLQFLAPAPSHELWWLVARDDFSDDILGALATAYLKTDKLPKRVKGSPLGMHRYTECLSALAETLEAYGATTDNPHNQTRFFIKGPGDQIVQAAIRRADPATDGSGFDMEKCRKAMEQLSLLTPGSFEFSQGEPSSVGALFLHREIPIEPGWVEAWLVHRWATQRNWKKIRCDQAVYLGKKQFRNDSPPALSAVGEEPEL